MNQQLGCFVVVPLCRCMLLLNDVVQFHLLSATQDMVYLLRGASLPAVCVLTMFQKIRARSLSPGGG